MQRSSFFGFAQRVAEEFVDFLADNPRGVFQHVAKCLGFAVKVGQEVFRAFRQIEDGFEIDDFGRGIGDGRKPLREQVEEP